MRIERRKFKAWLAAKRPDEIVGHNRNCNTCPIASFYSAENGCEVTIFQADHGYIADRGYDRRPLPWWASRFVSDVDGDEDGNITARRALQVLEGSAP